MGNEEIMELSISITQGDEADILATCKWEGADSNMALRLAKEIVREVKEMQIGKVPYDDRPKACKRALVNIGGQDILDYSTSDYDDLQEAACADLVVTVDITNEYVDLEIYDDDDDPTAINLVEIDPEGYDNQEGWGLYYNESSFETLIDRMIAAPSRFLFDSEIMQKLV